MDSSRKQPVLRSVYHISILKFGDFHLGIAYIGVNYPIFLKAYRTPERWTTLPSPPDLEMTDQTIHES